MPRKARVFPAGTRFGRLRTVADTIAVKGVRAEFICDCGTHTTKEVKRVVGGDTPQDCGCQGKESRKQIPHTDLTRYLLKRSGRLLVTGADFDAARPRGARTLLVCLCDCGAQTLVRPNNFAVGNTTSCGCARLESCKRVGESRLEHGHASKGELYEEGRTPIYSAWTKIRGICALGQARGFHKVCHEYDPRWDDFKEFYRDFGDISATETVVRRHNQHPWTKENCYVGRGRRQVPFKVHA